MTRSRRSIAELATDNVGRFTSEDVVRHPLVERIVNAYDADAARQQGR